MHKDLTKIRNNIDKIDKKIISLLEKRLDEVSKVSKLKHLEPDICFIKNTREVDMIKNLINITDKIPPITIFQIWRSIISLSLQTERSFVIEFYNDNKEGDLHRIIREYFAALTPIHNRKPQSILTVNHKVSDIIICYRNDIYQYKFLIENPAYKIFARLPDLTTDKFLLSDLSAIAKLEIKEREMSKLSIASKHSIPDVATQKQAEFNHNGNNYYIYEVAKEQFIRLNNKDNIIVLGGYIEVFS